ncbi:MAG TPA: hypothetical protein VFW77_01650 [Candidatus Saccharimonadales bacterium]|nr:hypothetical protein [Candidatus Saccharimonadales bacterium]
MARTAKKTTAKKTTKKTAGAKSSAKSVSKQAPAAKNNEGMVTLEKLYKFNLFSTIVNLAFAVLSVLFVSRNTVDFTLAHATKDALSGSSAMGPAYKILATVEIRYLMAFIFVLGAIFSLLLATKLRKNYEAGVKGSAAGWRWASMGITLGLILELATILGGIGDIFTLKLVGTLTFTAAILAWLNEKQNKGTKKQYAVFALGVFTGFAAWVPLAGSLLGTALYGAANFSWYVYTLAVLVLIGSLSIGLNQYRHARDGVTAKGYLQLEGKYLSTDFLVKLAVFAVLLIALHK